MTPAIPDERTMIEAAESDIRRRFPTVDTHHIEATVRTSVHTWLERARVKTFVPIFAAREARAVIERELATASS